MRTKPKVLFTVGLVSLLIFGCNVYRKSHLTLDQAAQGNAGAKVYYKNSEYQTYKALFKEGGNYYGLMKKAGRIPIDSLQVDYVRVKNKSASDATTAALAIGGSALVLYGIFMLIGLAILLSVF